MSDEIAADQASEQSAMDKIASKFGLGAVAEEAGQADTADAAPAEPDLWELNLNGETYKLPTKLKDSFMMKEDYTRKTQELAEQRKTYEQVSELARTSQLEKAFHESIAPEQNQLAVIDAYLSKAKELDWQNMDDRTFSRTRAELQDIKEQRAALSEQIEQKRAKFNSDMQTRFNELRGKARDAAGRFIKNFTEETDKSVREYAKAEGLTDVEIDSVLMDPRSYRVLYKAAQFDKVQQSAADPATKAERVIKPGASQNAMPKETADKLNYRRAMKSATNSGDKARIIEGRLAGMFGN